ncbi:MAG: hypothetical protein AAFV53_06335 [Myxococcota bacterium]
MKPWMRTTLIAALSVPLLAVGLVTLLVVQERSRWPTLEETPPVSGPDAPAPGDAKSWTALQAVMGQVHEGEGLRGVLETTGAPPEAQRKGWRRDAQAIESAHQYLAEHEGLSLPVLAYDEALPNMRPLLQLTDAMLLKGWDLASRGEVTAGAVEMLQAAQLGARLTHGDVDLIGAMIGLTIERRARTELAELLQGPGREDPAAFDRAATLLPTAADGVVARGVARECVAMDALYQQLTESPEIADELGDMPMGLSASGAYDPDITRVWNRMMCAEALQQLATPPSRRQPVEPLGLWQDGFHLTQYLHNPVGRILISVSTPNFTIYAERADVERARAAVLSTWIAARRYALAHQGEHPRDLDTLVPKYLASVPVDPMSGQKIQYDTAAVWSMGVSEEASLRLPL